MAAPKADAAAAAPAARAPSPETRASFPSRLLLLWIVPMVVRGWRAPLADADLPELRDEERGAYTSARLRKSWADAGARDDERARADAAASKAAADGGGGGGGRRKGKGKRRRGLGRLATAVYANHRWTLLTTGWLKAGDIALAALQPVMINKLLLFLRDMDQPRSRGFLWSAALFAMPLLKTLVENHYFLATMRGGMRVRSAVQGLLYDKSLSMSPAARASATVGEVVNLMQLDSQRAADFFQYVHVLWGAPVQILVTVALLFVYIGPSAAIGLLVTVATIPLQGHLMGVAVRLRARGVGITDQRVKMMNEILQGIKAVKFYAWEQPFMRQVGATRDEELKNFQKTIVVRSGFVTVMMVIPTLIAVVTFAFFSAVFKNALDPARVFTGIALLNQLRTPVMMLPMVVTSAIDAKLAVKRIQRFLALEDIDNYTGRGGAFDGGPGPSELEGKAAAADRASSAGSSDTAVGDESGQSSEPPAAPAAPAAARICVREGSFGWGAAGGPLQPPSAGKKRAGLLSKCFAKKNGPGGKKEAVEAGGKAVQEADGSEEEAGDGKAAEKVAPSPTAATAPFLRNISLDFKAGELTAVVGRVGSGKTSLVNAILGEMKKTAGDVSVVGSIAYVAQSAWIFNDTLKNNVLFGFPYDEARYRRAIRVSALEPDIAILPSGDATAIGEKGINLSGGQKQRVSIARAVYADADVYIFDDPLSALDSHVGQSVFDDCISRKGVLSRKLRVFITNQLQVLPECDRVVFMERGAQRMVGTYDELMADADFRQLANEVEKAAEDPDVAAAAPAAPGAAAGCDGPSNSMSLSIHEVAQAAEKSRAESRDGAPADHASPAYEATERDLASESRQTAEAEAVGDEGEGEKAGKDDGSKLIQEEERLTGNVLVRAYYRYAVACGGVVEFLIILALFCVSVALSVIVNWWLVYWSENSVGVAGKIDDSRSLGFYLGIYFGMGVLYAVLTFWRSVWYLTAALRASKSLHAAMLESVLRAPTSFFDQTPIGRIISRFSRDVNAVDQLLPQAFSQMLATVLNLLASYAYIATVFPIFLAVGVPVTFLYYLLQRFYNRTSIELKRLDSISKSPIYAGFSETLGGLSTIRAYHKQLQFRNENMERIDVNQRAYFSTIASNRWFSLYLEVFGSVLVFATALFAVLSRSTANPASAAAIGLSLTYALQVTGILGFTIRSITELELQMNSVERMDYYGKRLDQEAPAKLKEGNVLREGQVWPSAGEIDIRDAQMRYRPGLDLVLKGISIKIGAGEKVGIVGRTGSGKSSLMLVFLRLVELAGGSITIDGVNVAELGLDDVRSNITIIPQDPVLFSGTVRFNLDPFGVYSEPQLWDALAKSHLKEFVQEFEGGLDAKVTEYGENLSAGQKQLICLTRALLRKSKVLIMDEASSSLDYETDRLLQESIQANMADATILTIAHRLWTLTKCDKILVMRDGLASEFDSPEALLSNPASELRFLVDAMGEDGAARFKELVDENARAVGRTG